MWNTANLDERLTALENNMLVTDMYDTGWVQNLLTSPNGDWTNVDINISHNLSANISDLIIQFYISSDGTETNSVMVPLARDHGEADAHYGATVYNIDLKIIVKFAEIRRKLRKNGNLIDNFDILIAATCLTNDLVLITNNLKHFERIEGLKIFK